MDIAEEELSAKSDRMRLEMIVWEPLHRDYA